MTRTTQSFRRSGRCRMAAFFSNGFRPFFLGGAVWATLAMVFWIAELSGAVRLPIRFDAVSWHAHAFLYGYLVAIAAGFLLTAVPNWTGRPPLAGWPLAALFGLWVAGRVVVATSLFLPPLLVACVDLAFPLVFALVIGREIVVGRNWRNLVVLLLFTALAAGNGLFHWDAARGDFPARGAGLRFGLAVTVMLIGLIGGRIIPLFTRNWMVKGGRTPLPAGPMQLFDKAALLVLAAALLLWVAVPDGRLAGTALLLAGGVHIARLVRWQGVHTGAEPLVWVLHAGYAFLPLGALALGLSIIFPHLVPAAAAQHVWMAGAIGLMTLAVMTRATLGHTGQPLTVGRATNAIYISVIAATLLRFVAGAAPELASMFHTASGLAWIGAYGGFTLIYGKALTTPRK